ncbi:unnamed protein product [Knipowitschia caucasica]
MDTSQQLTLLPSFASPSASKCSPAVGSLFSPLNSYGRKVVLGFHTFSLVNDLNGAVNSCLHLNGGAMASPELEPFATEENDKKEMNIPQSVSGSQSGSLSESLDDNDCSSDPDPQEEEDFSDTSDTTDSEKDYGLTRKHVRLTHGTCDSPKKNHGSTARDEDAATRQQNRLCVPKISAQPPSPLPFQTSKKKYLRKPTIKRHMKEQRASLNPKLSSSTNSLYLSSSNSPYSKSPTQKSTHNERSCFSSPVVTDPAVMSRGLIADTNVLKWLVSITDATTQDQDARVYSSSQLSRRPSLHSHFHSHPSQNHTSEFTQDAPLPLVTKGHPQMDAPSVPRSPDSSPIDLSPNNKQPPSLSPSKLLTYVSVKQTCSPPRIYGQNKADKGHMENSDESLADDTEETSISTSDSGSSEGVSSEYSDSLKGCDGYRTHQILEKSSNQPSVLNHSLLKTSSCLDSFNRAHHSTATSSSVLGPAQRKRVTDEKALQIPLDFGWQRVTRARTVAGRLQGEVCYYAPCGKKLRQYPDVLKYLYRNGITEISRDNFSFSTKIQLGEFYLAKEGPEGSQWMPLSEDDIAACIIAMDGRRQKKDQGQEIFTGTPPLFQSQDAVNANLLRKLEAQEIAQQASQMRINKKLEKQARVQAEKEAKKQQAILMAEEKRKKKEQLKILKQQEKIRRIQQIRLEKEVRAQQIREAKRKKKEEAANAKILKAERQSQEREMKRQHALFQKHQVMELHRLDMVWEREWRRQHHMLQKEVDARKKAEEKERLKNERTNEKRVNKERKLELRRLELQELKKPREDLCLTDHKPLPVLSRIPGLVLSGKTFSDCLMVLQFKHRFGKVLSLKALSLCELQGGLLNMADSGEAKVLELLVNMVSAAVRDPSRPHTHKMKTASGEPLSDLKLDGANVSEALRIYMESDYEQDCCMSSLAQSLKTKDFRALQPEQKASILAYLVNKLCRCKAVVSEIDKTIDHMANLRKEKWITEGVLRKLRSTHAKRTGMKTAEGSLCPAPTNKRKRKEGYCEEEEDEDESDEEEETEEEEGRKSDCTAEDNNNAASVEELETQIKKAAKQKAELRQKLLESSYSLRPMMLGQDRYKRSYWLLPECGGVFVEGMETHLGHVDVLTEERCATVNKSPLRGTEAATEPSLCIHNNARGSSSTNPDESLPECTHFTIDQYKSISSPSVPLHRDSSAFVNQWISHLPPCNKAFVNSSLVPSSSSSQMCSVLASSACSPEDEDVRQQQSGTHRGSEILCDLSKELTSSSLPFAGSAVPPSKDLASQHAQGDENTIPFQTVSEPQSRTAPCDNSPAEEVAQHQEHFSPLPVPQDMLNGWWWMSNVEELHHLSKALHCRGIRERALTKQLQKHMEYLDWLYLHKTDAVIDVAELQKQAGFKEMVDRWCVQEQAMKWDIEALKRVEALAGVISARLQMKDWASPKLQAQCPKSPLDVAVSRLAELERNIQWRKEDEDAPWRQQWHKAVAQVSSSAQLVLCIQQLQKNMPWNQVMKVECQVCLSGDDEESLLLCDSCGKGFHVYCHEPRVSSIPESNWFCSLCSSKDGVVQQIFWSQRTQRHPSPTSGRGKRPSEVKPNGKPSESEELIKEETSSRSSRVPRKRIKESRKRRADHATPSSQRDQDPAVKRDIRREELEMCQQLLDELDSHPSAWPFLRPVCFKSVPGYKKVVKKPMDFSTIRHKLIHKPYTNVESFMDDVNLVFDNCERFNEDDSEIGKAGHIMRRFFHKRRTELLNRI